MIQKKPLRFLEDNIVRFIKVQEKKEGGFQLVVFDEYDTHLTVILTDNPSFK